MDEFRKKPVNRIANRQIQPVDARTTQNIPKPMPIASPVPQTTQPAQSPSQAAPVIAPQPLHSDTGLAVNSAKKPFKKRAIRALLLLAAVVVVAIIGLFAWYSYELSPVDAHATDKKLIKIESGSTPSEIASLLKKENVIRNQDIFLWYARFHKVQNSLQAGSYRLSSSDSTPEIVDHLSSGKVDTFNITFLPGATLEDNRKSFISAGYSEGDVDKAFAKTYNSPLFEGKPANADLEGYIYGETYSFGTETSVEAILEHVFEEYYSVIEENGLVAKYKDHGLSLYEGITLASIVQREASPAADDMPQIAQVFYTRLATGMPLGSDVTYQYIADKTGAPRDPNLDSPYNTRKYPGLPPGPISSPGKKALNAVANPAAGDYVYFLSGDDNVTYFARSLDEHEANITNHCQKKCQIL